MNKIPQKNRGKYLETVIEASNRQYSERQLALVNKIPTPTKISQKKGYAYYSEKSTVDFIGVYRKKHVAFDTKEVQRTSFPFGRLSDHQYKFLLNTHNQGGEAFILILFKHVNELYRLDIAMYQLLKSKLDRKSIPYEWFNTNLTPIKSKNGVYYDYLDIAHV
ncbi:Holliday junction resolvase RecU [Staphylococcus felis]|uniref:Holliday junction resolvase RecU n=1 Tax=Staphylococcus felis TaxID=46127 RepID=UPI0039675FDC